MLLTDIVPLIQSQEETIRFAKEHGLIKRKRSCPKCRRQMRFVPKNDLHDMYIWQCSRVGCKKNLSIRYRSFFSDSKLSISTIIYIMYLWSIEMTVQQTVFQTNVSKRVVIDWFRFCRDIIFYHYRNDTEHKIGGKGVIVEIDESLVSRRKYNRGRLISQVWMFGGIERENNKQFFAEIVADRTTKTLLSVIKRRIRKGSIIMSDKWKAYNCLKDNGYQHFTINHSENFVDPNNPLIHTQGIESKWAKIKRKIKAKGLNLKQHMEEYILEYMYRQKFDNTDIFEHLIMDINNKHPL